MLRQAVTRLWAVAGIAGTGRPEIGRLVSAEHGGKFGGVLASLLDLLIQLSGEVCPREQVPAIWMDLLWI